MRVTVTFEIETTDYGGPEFQQEVENLLLDIDPVSQLKKFKMQITGDPNPEFDYRSVDWSDNG
jgi:hypothetical protein